MSTFTLTPGNAVSCYVNTHRAAWDGTICDDPVGWNCAATPEFRRDYCARGTPRCYHLRTFDGPEPSFLMDDYGAGWILGANPRTLDDQILLILAREGVEPNGIREEGRRRYKVAGAYRIKEIRRVEQGHRVLWQVFPHADGWTRFHQFYVDSPRFEHAGGPYIKQIDRELILRVFAEAADAATRPDPDWGESGAAERFRNFHANLPGWLDEAARVAARSPRRGTWRALSAESVSAVGEEGHGPLADLPRLGARTSAPHRSTTPQDLSQSRPEEARTDDIDGDPFCERPPLLEPARREWVRSSYGDDACNAIQVASLTKEILILRGTPGVGKSYLATRLLDDPSRERTLVVPVSATWRGGDDLFGHGLFTEFLIEAAKAWQEGDKRARVVVFEGFNLSRPEHWLTEVLVASQSGHDRDRFMQLENGTQVYYSPAIRFVATVDQDEAVQPLSARILDRSAVVDLRREPRQSLACAGLRILEDMTMAIADLDFLIRPKGASFSLRSALSLRACLEELESLGLQEWDAVDLVLVQEVLSKVRLVPDDPIDEGVLSDLKGWQDRHGKNLSRCSSMISEWEEKLRSGVDVVQA